MIYLKSFLLCEESLQNTNIYPHNVFIKKDPQPFIFEPITVLYGNNASGKSTILNIIANKLLLKGAEKVGSHQVEYFYNFIEKCKVGYSEESKGKIKQALLAGKYIKSEDVLYEVKKIQQKKALEVDYQLNELKKGKKLAELNNIIDSYKYKLQIQKLEFAQEKYSNGEMSLKIFEEIINVNGIYLIDEPEVSLSPQNQVILANKINEMSRFFGNQFIIATHSPFMLAILNSKIYNLDTTDYKIANWTELENVKYYYDFFKEREDEFK